MNSVHSPTPSQIPNHTPCNLDFQISNSEPQTPHPASCSLSRAVHSQREGPVYPTPLNPKPLNPETFHPQPQTPIPETFHSKPKVHLQNRIARAGAGPQTPIPTPQTPNPKPLKSETPDSDPQTLKLFNPKPRNISPQTEPHIENRIARAGAGVAQRKRRGRAPGRLHSHHHHQSSLISSLSHSHITLKLKWCDEIKLSNLLLSRKRDTVKRIQLLSLSALQVNCIVATEPRCNTLKLSRTFT